MAWYAYCVAEKQCFPELLHHRKPVPLEQTSGIDDNQVFLYPAADLAVAVSEYVPSATDPHQRAKEHARVVAACFQLATVLPFRFGTIFPNDELLRRSIRSNQRNFLLNLSQLAGKSEMHLRLTIDDCCREQVLAMSSATHTYLSDLRQSATRQRERQTRARALSTQLNRMFSPLSEEIACRRLDNGKIQLDVSHLIATRTVERYVNKFGAVREIMRDCHMQLTGPRPPYHFVQSVSRNITPPAHLPASPRAIPA